MKLLKSLPMLILVTIFLLTALTESSLGRTTHLSMFGSHEGPPIPDETCGEVGETCFYSSDCCSGLCKVNGNICVLSLPPVPEETCTELGLTCFYSADCCSGLCKVNGNVCIEADSA